MQLNSKFVRIPEVCLQDAGCMIDHSAHAVRAAAGESSADTFLHNVEHIVHHAGAQLTHLSGVHDNCL